MLPGKIDQPSADEILHGGLAAKFVPVQDLTDGSFVGRAGVRAVKMDRVRFVPAELTAAFSRYGQGSTTGHAMRAFDPADPVDA